MSDIEPVFITPASLSPKALQQLDGVELDLLGDIGVNLFAGAMSHRALIGIGWIHLRRKYPDKNLSYEAARPHIIWNIADDDGDSEVPEVDPTVADDSET